MNNSKIRIDLANTVKVLKYAESISLKKLPFFTAYEAFPRNLECVANEQGAFTCKTVNITNTDDKTLLKTGQRTISLVVSNLSLSHAGFYKIVAMNRWGNASDGIDLKVNRFAKIYIYFKT